MKVYTVAVGIFDPFNRRSRKAVKFISTLKGLVGVHPHYPDGTLILFRTENDAKIARNEMQSKGILTGRNICEAEIDDKYAEGANDERN